MTRGRRGPEPERASHPAMLAFVSAEAAFAVAVRAMRTRRSAAALVLGLLLSLAPATLAVADPLTETEPNNDLLHANGPIPADGILLTKNVSDDVDYFTLRLQGQRQVTITVKGVADGGGAMELTNARTGRGVGATGATKGGVNTFSFTTPRDPTEYDGRTLSSLNSFGFAAGTILVQASPADAVITGPLPTPDYGRTLTVAAPATAARNASVTVPVAGVAADDDRVEVQWQTGGGCSATPGSGDHGVVNGPLLAAGAFNTTVTATTPDDADTATLCVWLVDTLGVLPSLVRQQSVVVDSDADGIPDAADACATTAGVLPTGCPDKDHDGIQDTADRCPTRGGPPPGGCPVATRYDTRLSLRRSGAHYSGKVTAGSRFCVSGRRVVLRLRGHGTRSFGQTTTRSDGTFTIALRHRLRGTVTAVAASRTSPSTICRVAGSRAIRG